MRQVETCNYLEYTGVQRSENLLLVYHVYSFFFVAGSNL